MISLVFTVKDLMQTEIQKALEKDVIEEESKIRPLTLRTETGYHASN